MREWKSHWVHANPSERGKHRIIEKGGRFIYQKLINGKWADQPAQELPLKARWG